MPLSRSRILAPEPLAAAGLAAAGAVAPPAAGAVVATAAGAAPEAAGAVVAAGAGALAGAVVVAAPDVVVEAAGRVGAAPGLARCRRQRVVAVQRRGRRDAERGEDGGRQVVALDEGVAGGAGALRARTAHEQRHVHQLGVQA